MPLSSFIRNERGLTLLELMASLLLTAVILGGGLAFWWSLQTNTNMVAASQRQEASIRWTAKQFHHLISEASAAVLVTREELRLRVGQQYRAVLHDSAAEEWRVYSFTLPSGSSNITENDALNRLASTSVTLASNPERYEYIYSLADNMADPPRIRIIQLPDGSKADSAALPAIAKAGSLLEAELDFHSVIRDSMGRPVLDQGDPQARYTITAKLMRDR
ncbi:prepilin-type cleavage/methylation domain-containing protein [Paenibacillus thiaminolyticus]|uniref:prepilin-type N-terminal cleavage/methylation domain-containing protein n=1 Tax=Paenibacillus thiaminolyticus TaxID=49283 RepID=UPI00116522B9|nr:prepilin-type N-terminal cleavage/methylation domain-containing protein [Paenibacillus thiaminolyticus]NGP57995.1 prepilin-type cleavage/methylation domain-containing protein [Paenibacillus thiaminolyticus]